MSTRRKPMWLPSSETRLGLFAGACIVGILILIAARAQGPKSRSGNGSQEHGLVHLTIAPVAFDPPTFDYGQIFQRETVNHAFRLVNNSTNEMRVVAIQVSCSCTLVSTNLLGEVLRPRNEMLVPVMFESGSRAGPSDSTVDVALQGGGVRYRAQARLHGTVVADFSFEPKALDFGKLRPGETATRSVVFRPEALTQLELTATQTWRGPFEISVLQGTVSVTLHAPEVTHRETYSQAARVATSSKRVPEAAIPLTGQVVPDVEISPEVLILPANEAVGESRLTLLTEQPSRITRIRNDAKRTEALQAFEDDDRALNDWALSHNFRLINSALLDTKRIDVEFELRHGTGQSEARSASVQIRSLERKER